MDILSEELLLSSNSKDALDPLYDYINQSFIRSLTWKGRIVNTVKCSGLLMKDTSQTTTEDQIPGSLKQEDIIRLTLTIQLTDNLEISWDALLMNNQLYIQIPTGLLEAGSKESFVTILEYAEDVLKCSHVFVFFDKDRKDRGVLVRTFMFLGFEVLDPENQLCTVSRGSVFMGYNVED